MNTNYKLIAELGCNHQGELSIAKEMILKAKQGGCHIVKFQKRTPKLQFTPEKYNSPHPNPEKSFGKTYGEHREKLEFSIDEHKELKKYAEQNNIDYCTSIFDIVSAKEILNLKPKHIKIPSTINNNYEIIEYIAKNFNGTIHVSLGMTTDEEEKKLINIIDSHSKLKNTVLYHCISAYPVPEKDLSLLEINKIKEKYSDKILAIGYSGHHEGVLADCIALGLGATYIERHFTFDKKAKGSDHKISLDYNEIKILADELNKTKNFLKYKEKEILDCENNTRKFHKENYITQNE